MSQARECPECDSGRIVTSGDSAEEICDTCGLVVDTDQIDRGPEWRAFNAEERESRSRVGMPLTQLIHDRGLTTEIGWQDKDSQDRRLSPRRREQMRRLRTWQERIRTQSADERNLQLALSEIQRMASVLDVPESIREVAGARYRQALDDDLVRGRSIESVASSCLYIACRQEEIPRSMAEIADVSRVEKTEIGRTYRYVSANLGLAVEPVDPKLYVPRFASALDVSDEIRSTATSIIDDCVERGVHSGKSPTGFAAAAIYTAALLCDEKRTQGEVASVADVTKVTIRNRYQEQVNVLDRECP
jgi:transcription initiation factor TFIIB